MTQEFIYSVIINLKKIGTNCANMCSLERTSNLHKRAELVDKLGMGMNTRHIHWQGTILNIYENEITYKYSMRFSTSLLSYPSQLLFPVRVSSVYSTFREFSWPSQCWFYIWSTNAPVCHHLKITWYCRHHGIEVWNQNKLYIILK